MFFYVYSASLPDLETILPPIFSMILVMLFRNRESFQNVILLSLWWTLYELSYWDNLTSTGLCTEGKPSSCLIVSTILYMLSCVLILVVLSHSFPLFNMFVSCFALSVLSMD